MKVVVVGLGALVVDSSMKSSSRSSLAKLGLVRKSNEALMLGEGVVDFSGTAGVTLKVVALNRPPDANSSSSYENDLKRSVILKTNYQKNFQCKISLKLPYLYLTLLSCCFVFIFDKLLFILFWMHIQKDKDDNFFKGKTHNNENFFLMYGLVEEIEFSSSGLFVF